MDPEVFFPLRGATMQYQEALEICSGCPVRGECLQANLDEPVGIWGGTTGRQRKRIRVVYRKTGVLKMQSVLG